MQCSSHINVIRVLFSSGVKFRDTIAKSAKITLVRIVTFTVTYIDHENIDGPYDPISTLTFQTSRPRPCRRRFRWSTHRRLWVTDWRSAVASNPRHKHRKSSGGDTVSIWWKSRFLDWRSVNISFESVLNLWFDLWKRPDSAPLDLIIMRLWMSINQSVWCAKHDQSFYLIWYSVWSFMLKALRQTHLAKLCVRLFPICPI